MTNHDLMSYHTTAIAEHHLKVSRAAGYNRQQLISVGAIRKALKEAYKMGALEGRQA